MQNQELLQPAGRAGPGAARYFDLYDLAPVGYCTLSGGTDQGGQPDRGHPAGAGAQPLVGQPVVRFVFDTGRDIYHR